MDERFDKLVNAQQEFRNVKVTAVNDGGKTVTMVGQPIAVAKITSIGEVEQISFVFVGSPDVNKVWGESLESMKVEVLN